MHIFAQAFPERFQMGMAEQLLLGASAGMAETGLVPWLAFTLENHTKIGGLFETVAAGNVERGLGKGGLDRPARRVPRRRSAPDTA